MVHNPAGNKLYLLCPAQDEVLVLDSTLGSRDTSFKARSTPTAGRAGPTLNRLYIADDDVLRVIDCNSDSVVRTFDLPGISRPVR